MTQDEIIAHLTTDGFCHTPEVIPRDDVTQVRESVEATVQSPEYQESKGGHLIEYDQSFAPYLTDERITEVLRTLWGPYSRISFTRYIAQQPNPDARDKGPGQHGVCHSDWPYGQRYEGHLIAPYPDTVLTVTTVWMLSPFTDETGGTFVVPGSHKANNNPTGGYGTAEDAPYPTEVQVKGEPGDVLMFDARAWHAAGVNISNRTRSAMRVCWAPWWLNVNILDPDSPERVPMEAAGRAPFVVRKLRAGAFETLPDDVKPLFRHWVAD